MPAADLVQRYDNGKISKFTVTSQGFIKIPARLTRTGILEYVRSDGSVQKELRLPEEVFNKDSLATLALAPVTDLHPSVMVSPANVRELQIGVGSEAPKQDGKFVASELTIQAQVGIDGVKSGNRKEISLGYHCKLDRTPGVFEGEKYDCIQRDIRYNHIAIGPAGWGRAGSEVALRLDGQDALSEFDASVGDVSQETQALSQSKDSRKTMDEIEIKLDGVTVKVSKLAAELFNKELAALQAKLDASEKSRGAVEASNKEVQAKLDAASDPKAFQARVDARVALEATARSVLGKDEKLDGLSEREVHTKALSKLSPKADYSKQSDAYVQGAFASLTAEGRTDSSLAAANAEALKAQNSERKDAKSLRDEANKRKANQYKSFGKKESK